MTLIMRARRAIKRGIKAIWPTRQQQVWGGSVSILLLYAILTAGSYDAVPGIGFAQVSSVCVCLDAVPGIGFAQVSGEEKIKI